MKEVYRNDEVAAYSGLKDVFGNKMYVVTNDLMNTLRLYSKHKDFKKRRRMLDDAGHTNVWTPEWGEAIDTGAYETGRAVLHTKTYYTF